MMQWELVELATGRIVQSGEVILDEYVFKKAFGDAFIIENCVEVLKKGKLYYLPLLTTHPYVLVPTVGSE